MPNMGEDSIIGWLVFFVALIGGLLFWLLPTPSPPISNSGEIRSFWNSLPSWRSLLSIILVGFAILALFNLLFAASLYSFATVFSPEQGAEGDVVIIAADAETRASQGGGNEDVMRAQLGQALVLVSRTQPRGILLLREFSGSSAGDSALLTGLEAVGEQGIPLAFVPDPNKDNPLELVECWQRFDKTMQPVSLRALKCLDISVGVDSETEGSPLGVLMGDNAPQGTLWVRFGKPMHPLYSMWEFNLGSSMQNRRDPASDPENAAELCRGKFVIITELLSGGIMRTYRTPINEVMPAHQFWALVLDDAARGKQALPLPGSFAGLWILLCCVAGALLSRAAKGAGLGLLVAVISVGIAMAAYIFWGIWMGVFPALIAAGLSGFLDMRSWSNTE